MKAVQDLQLRFSAFFLLLLWFVSFCLLSFFSLFLLPFFRYAQITYPPWILTIMVLFVFLARFMNPYITLHLVHFTIFSAIVGYITIIKNYISTAGFQFLVGELVDNCIFQKYTNILCYQTSEKRTSHFALFKINRALVAIIAQQYSMGNGKKSAVVGAFLLLYTGNVHDNIS